MRCQHYNTCPFKPYNCSTCRENEDGVHCQPRKKTIVITSKKEYEVDIDINSDTWVENNPERIKNDLYEEYEYEEVI